MNEMYYIFFSQVKASYWIYATSKILLKSLRNMLTHILEWF